MADHNDARTNAANDAPKRSESPYQEPPNSTVDDWLGQRVQRDEELADRLMEASDGDEQLAEERFEQISHEQEEYHSAHDQSQRDRS